MSTLDRVYTKTLDEPPGEFTVVCRSGPIEPHGQRVWMRVANCNTLEDARQAITRDLEALADTLGGLMTPVSSAGREYAIWKANWERVPL
jgi:hypothetical protein